MADLNFFELWLVCLGAVAVFMSLAFAIAHKLGRYDLVDVFWGLAFVVVVVASIWANGGSGTAGLVVAGLVIIWAVRLSWYILRRFLRSNREDIRYIEIRKNWPKKYLMLQAYVKIFILQAILACVVGLPIIAAVKAGQDITVITWIGALIWLAGFVFEAVGDKQLSNFIRNPANKGKLMTTGLWKYSRHPNYFGEIVQWYGIWFITLSSSYWFIALIGPVLITLLLTFVSGVPLAEKRSNNKPGWQEYKNSTSVLIPLPKK